jgi:hypothetical protein
MKLPTHYLRPVDGNKNGIPHLVYGWQTPDGMFTSTDGRKYPADMAVPIDQPNNSPSRQSR